MRAGENCISKYFLDPPANSLKLKDWTHQDYLIFMFISFIFRTSYSDSNYDLIYPCHCTLNGIEFLM